MSTQPNAEAPQQNMLTPQQKQQFHDDGFLFVRNLLPNKALQPLIDELAQRVDDSTQAAVKHGILNPADTYDGEPFENAARTRIECLFRPELDLEQLFSRSENSDSWNVHAQNCPHAP